MTISDSIERLNRDQLAPDTTSAAFQHGRDQALRGRPFRNPCSGNPQATHQHWLGYHAGERERECAANIHDKRIFPAESELGWMDDMSRAEREFGC